MYYFTLIIPYKSCIINIVIKYNGKNMISERIKSLQILCAQRGKEMQSTHFYKDYHTSALTKYKNCPLWEKSARAMAYAVANQDVWAYEGDDIGGRTYYWKEDENYTVCPDLDYVTESFDIFKQQQPLADQMYENTLIFPMTFGHITWRYDYILSLGIDGFKQKFVSALEKTTDQKAKEFYSGVIIMLDAMQAFNDKHVAVYQKMGNTRLANIMKRVPKNPCQTFEEAVQAYFMQHIVVMSENPYGGNGPGRLDYFLWPYLKNDLEKGIITLQRAKELIDELFLRIDERIYNIDTWTEAIVVGGTNPDGTSAVNPLTYIMIESVMDLNIIHPSVYVRIPQNPEEKLLDICSKYMLSGNNRAQILNDQSIINALVENGTPYEDAVHYVCGGCMEIGVQGKNSDLLYTGWQNIPKMLELMITGGVCLKTGEKINSFKATKSLTAYKTFNDFYSDFLQEVKRLAYIHFQEQDVFSEVVERKRPSYLISSMIGDCLARGKGMHAGGAVYHDYGVTPLGLPNVADGLFAIKKAVYEDKICTANELIDALKANFKGFEQLQYKLKKYAKYGVDDDQADQMMNKVSADISDLYLSYKTRHGGKAMPTILTFIYAPHAASKLGATPDGRNAGGLVAHGVTPQSCAMTQGVSAAINSCGKLPFNKFAGGASTMWDFDSNWVNQDIVKAVLKTFIAKGGQIFQGNTTSVQDLLNAKKNPENYSHLMVRVGGYSARFTYLGEELQNEIIQRIRHNG